MIVLFALPIALYYTVKTVYLLKDDNYKKTIYGNEIYRAIEKSKIKTQYKKLILGDSTANQFYNCKEEDPDSAYSLSCNQAIGMIGQFILLHNYLEAGNNDEYKPLMSSLVIDQIEKLPKHGLCHFPLIQTTGWAPNIKKEKRAYSFLSPICKEYLSKINNLSDKYHFAFKIIPTFVAEHWQDSIKHFNHAEFTDSNYKIELLHYLENITYLPDSCFIDEVHLRNPQLYKPIINQQLHLH